METVIFDIECSCEDKNINPNYNMETIEIGAVKIKDGKIVDEFQSFVKPEYTESLTPFCQDLTKISYSDLENAPSFETVMLDFYDFIKGTSIMSCGDFDKKFLTREIKGKKLDKPLGLVMKAIWSSHSNLKVHYNNISGFKMAGMLEMAKRLNVKVEGAHHRGIDDARNLAKIYLELERLREKNLRNALNSKSMIKIVERVNSEPDSKSISLDSIQSYSEFFDYYRDMILIDHIALGHCYLKKEELLAIEKMSI